LERKRNLNEYCSGAESDDFSSCSEEEVATTELESETIEDNNENTSSTTDDNNEIIRNLFTIKRKRIVIVSESEDECTEKTKNGLDGTAWIKLKDGGCSGRSPYQNIFMQHSGPTSYSKQNIMKDNVQSSFSLIIDNRIMKYLEVCTEAEVRRVLNTNWTTTLQELNAFIGLLYGRGAYEVRNLKLSVSINVTDCELISDISITSSISGISFDCNT